MLKIMHQPVSAEIQKHWAAQYLPHFLYFGYALLVVLSVNNGFFWDTILQAAQSGQWFYFNNFSRLFYPDELDVGYPPLFGMFMAAGWKLFGYNLLVSHLLMLPFALGIVHQVLALSRKFLSPNAASIAALIALLDPTLLAQVTQVSPDLVLTFLYIFCLNQLKNNRRLPVAIALIFLGLISLRGTVGVACIFFSDVLLSFITTRKPGFKALLALVVTYVPAFLIVCSWLLLHYLHTGWVGYNPDPNWNWSGGRQLVSFPEMIRNGAIIIWRVVDFGRLFIWFGLAAALVYLYNKNIKLPPKTWQLLALALIPLLVFSLISLPYSNPVGHRYYMMSFLLLALLVCYLWAHIPNRFLRRIAYGFMLVGLLTGHFWIYPDSVAKGWDATLAHTPYFELRREAVAYLDEKNIALETVGSDFPNLAPASVTDLNNDTRHFKAKDLQTDKRILYSNIFNGFTDEELAELQTNWQVLKSWKKGQVKMILYEKNN